MIINYFNDPESNYFEEIRLINYASIVTVSADERERVRERERERERERKRERESISTIQHSIRCYSLQTD